jgi:hypothetical protein
MAALKVSDVAAGTLETYKTEWLITSSADLEDIPPVAPGSVAYTADLTYMAMFDGDTWQQIGGGA